jgi:hypothetical protein
VSPLRRHLITTWIAAVLVLTGPGANAMLLDYEAYLGETKVGEAQVTIDVGEQGYAIEGKAESTGLLGLFSKWKSFFSTRGFFFFGKPVASAYEVKEQSGSKEKEISYSGDKVYVTKNGKSRNPMPLPAATDFWSLLFLSKDCGDESVVHDGKDVWRVKTLSSKSLEDGRRYCEFDLRDEDNERSSAAVWTQQIGDLTVPVEVHLEGAIRGTFKLTDHALD